MLDYGKLLNFALKILNSFQKFCKFFGLDFFSRAKSKRLFKQLLHENTPTLMCPPLRMNITVSFFS